MNNIQKTIISVATATIIGGGIVVYETYDNEIEPIDWSLYELNIPSIELPELQLVSLDIPSLNSPELHVDSAGMESLTDNIINVGMESLTDNIINVQELNETVGQIDATMNLFQLEKPDKDFNSWVAYVKDNKKFFVDNRMINYDKNLFIPNDNVKQWKQIYKRYQNVNINYVPIKNKFRMITEVRTPVNSNQLNILTQNLKYYKSQGYNSVLYGFTKEDNVDDVLNTIKYIIKNFQMNVWLTYTGEENLYQTVFMNPYKYASILKQTAPYISGYVNSWRRTSAHLWKQDQAFMNYTNYTLRSVNPNLPIIGQLYYGNTYKYEGHGNTGFELNDFKNSSGIMIVNFGFRKVNIQYLLSRILKPFIKNRPVIACVVGDKPYYINDNNNHLGYEQNIKIKKEIENDFFKNGCIGTITLSDDGKHLNTNNLSVTLYSTLNGR